VLRTIFSAKDVYLQQHGSCVADLSIQAAAYRNAQIPTYKTTYYFSYVTQHCRRSLLNSTYYWPHPNMHWLIMSLSGITGRWSPVQKPFPAFRAKDWYNNDGPVSVISQCYPFVTSEQGFRHPPHILQNNWRHSDACNWEGIQPHDHAPLIMATTQTQARPQKGVWYYSPPIYMDHMTVAMAPRSRVDQHQDLYNYIRRQARDMSSSHLSEMFGTTMTDTYATSTTTPGVHKQKNDVNPLAMNHHTTKEYTDFGTRICPQLKMCSSRTDVRGMRHFPDNDDDEDEDEDACNNSNTVDSPTESQSTRASAKRTKKKGRHQSSWSSTEDEAESSEPSCGINKSDTDEVSSTDWQLSSSLYLVESEDMDT
jgi:hypothetical protein